MTAKVPYPRTLTANESLDTLTHWRSHVRNYFRRDDNLKQFFARDKTWNPDEVNYGFVGDTAVSDADYLESLLDTISGFMPGPYLTAKITKQTKSMEDVFKIIWQHYDVEPSPSTFLDFADLKLTNDERYIDLYYRMQYHAEQHLLQRGATVEGIQLAASETLSYSHKNLIALNWIQAIDPSLLSIVRLEKHQELKEGKQLYALVQDISKNIDDWMKRHGHKPPSRMKEQGAADTSTVRNVRYESNRPFSTPRGMGDRGQPPGRSFGGTRGSYRSYSNRFTSNRPASSARQFCPGCNYLGQELGLAVNFRHYPAQCPRRTKVVRLLKAEEEDLAAEYAQEEADDHHEHEDGQHNPPDDHHEGTKLYSSSHVPLGSAHKSGIKNEDSIPFINAVWKCKSPSILMFLKEYPVIAVIDEGSEISAINSEVVEALNIPISRTVESAQAAGSQHLKIIGKTSQDVILSKTVHSSKIKWNLGQCLIIQNLGCELLIGEPAKMKNEINTHPVTKNISTVDVDDNKVVLSYTSSDQSMHLSDSNRNHEEQQHTVRFAKAQSVYPNDTVSVCVPKALSNQTDILVETSEKSKFPGPGIYSVNNQMLKFPNDTECIQKVSEDDILICSKLIKPSFSYGRNPQDYEDDIQTKCSDKKDDFPSMSSNFNGKDESMRIRKLYDISRQNMSQFEFPHDDLENASDMLQQVSIDPDSRLTVQQQVMFKDLIYSYADVFTDRPGRYNGYYGQVNCSLTITEQLPPSSKPRIPNYSTDKLNAMADLMDKMENWNVLVKPESIGVVPTHIHPCILVPKDNGNFRLVTDFRSIQNHIKPLPTIMPTVSEAMHALSASEYHIELDFSNFYWQNAIPREDSEKLAVYHPFGGLRVYVVCPQGLRNSAEWGSEILARIYGDMVKERKITRIADQIYVLGNSIMELNANFQEVLQRCRRSNLTFKPSKVVICPSSTVILGWKKTDSAWSPTEHVLSPLSSAEPPSTVKKLRGWLGAFRQISKTIPNHAVVLKSFEKLVGGKNSRDKIIWTPQLLKEFDLAKQSVQTVAPITIPRRSDKLKIYSDWSQDADAVGGRLVIERKVNGKNIQLNGGQFSCRLKGAQSRWTPCEKECLAIKLLVHHFQPFIRESDQLTTILTDNIVAVHAWKAVQTGRISSSSRVASFISTLCENRVEVVHFPGELTKLADYNSRFPVKCSESKCQTCKFINHEILIHDHYVRRVTEVSHEKDVFLIQRPTWLALQKQDKTLLNLVALIKNGMAPEKKSKNKHLKLLHNMYRRGSLFLASDGLIQVKQADLVHDVEYQPIVVPEIYVSSVIQSLHLKLNHPSAYQLNKIMTRHFFAIGLAKSISNVSSSCDTCVRLKILPKQAQLSQTSKNDTFGTRFSADILIEKGQHILLCREKLSQFSTTCFLPDESKNSIEEGLVKLIIDFIPDSGALVQVDAGPGFTALDRDQNTVLASLNIKLDIGRVHNKNKNPVAENAIKEFRKEWLRLKPDGSSLNELERSKITSIMNKRIRINGLAPKEYVLKRSLLNHSPISVDDGVEGDSQQIRRSDVNAKQYKRDLIAKSKPGQNILKVGDLVYILADLSKSRSREQYIVTKTFFNNNQQWIVVRKSQKNLRNKEYLLKASEVYLAPITENLGEADDDDEDECVEQFQGFQQNISMEKRDHIKQLIKSMEESMPSEKKTGRPKKLRYPDYRHVLQEDVQVTEDDEVLYGFQQEHNQSDKLEKIKDIISAMEQEDDACYGFSEKEVKSAMDNKSQLDEVVQTHQNMCRCTISYLSKKRRTVHPWDHDQWLKILDQDLFEEKKVHVPVQRRIESIDNVSLASLEYDNSEMFLSMTDHDLSAAAVMAEDDVTTVDDFLLHFELHRPPRSTPTKNVKSETDPLMLDKIPVMTESDSSLEGIQESSFQEPADNVFYDLPSHPMHVSQALQELHDHCPELSAPQEGRVYNMSQVLSNIDRHTSAQDDNSVSDQVQCRPKRTVNKRVDYRLLNLRGAVAPKEE